jgi:ubiquinone/menaquinone biosynthesis C-methylase UbiE
MTSTILRSLKVNEKMERWEGKEGVKFLRKAGIRKNHIVLDFGCGVGHYAIPAARIVAGTGFVYAVDKEQQAINKLRRKAHANNLKNIKVIKTLGQIKLDFESEAIDVVLFYDILHYLEEKDRKTLYREASRTLKRDGLLSVYPKHILEDDPIQEFRRLSLSDVKHEIESSKFVFEQKHCSLISHDDGLNQGCVLNFSKCP